MNWSQEISRSRNRSAGSASGGTTVPAGARTTNRPLEARGWWVRLSVAAALAIDTSLTMLASAEASAAASLAEVVSSTLSPVSAVMAQSCQALRALYWPSTATSVKPRRA